MLWIYPSKRSRFLSFRAHTTPESDFWLVKIFLEWCSSWFLWVLWDFRKSAQNYDRMIKTLKCFPSSNHSKKLKSVLKMMVNNLDQNILKIQAAVLVRIAPWKSSLDKNQLGVWQHAWLGVWLHAWLGMRPQRSGLFVILRPRFLPVSLRVPGY